MNKEEREEEEEGWMNTSAGEGRRTRPMKKKEVEDGRGKRMNEEGGT